MTYLWDIENAYASKSGKYKTTIETQFISKYIGINKKKILDIGGGSGRFAIPLSNQGHDLTVVEPNKEAIEILKKRNSEIKVINSSFEEANITGLFDVILVIEVFGSFENIEEAFLRISKLCKEGGIVILSVKN